MTEPFRRSATTAKNLAVFIDADNLCDATALDHVLTELRSRADRLLYKRAYGRSESLKAIEAVLWRHGVRPVANMIVNKVTTDSALVIDAVEAVCTSEIDAVAICSGDADFVPLATWIRERGCQVLCFSLSNKIFANPESFYDDVVLLEVVEKTETALGRGAETALEEPPPLRDTSLQLVKMPTPAAKAKKTDAPPKDQGVDVVERILRAVPELRSGGTLHLNHVVRTLRQDGILGASERTAAWFTQWSANFELTPSTAPCQIRYKKIASITGAASAKKAPAPGLKARLPHEVARILKAVPALSEEPQMLSQVVPVLRQKAILGKTTKSTSFFSQYAQYFQLKPKQKPTQIIFLPPVVTVAKTSV
jgi:uncharacterized protein (TIGR00288 family)